MDLNQSFIFFFFSQNLHFGLHQSFYLKKIKQIFSKIHFGITKNEVF